MSQNKENNRIVNRDISQEMRESYIDYAMSVIVSRALPDVRDGLKPVHRKISLHYASGRLDSFGEILEVGGYCRRRSRKISPARRCVGV